MKLIAVESPYGDKNNITIMRNINYLRACLRYVHLRGNAPYASHAISTQPHVLNDRDEKERDTGIEAGQAWSDRADERWVFADLGISKGMEYGIARAKKIGQPIRIIRLNYGYRGAPHNDDHKEQKDFWKFFLGPAKSDDKAWEWADNTDSSRGDRDWVPYRMSIAGELRTNCCFPEEEFELIEPGELYDG